MKQSRKIVSTLMVSTMEETIRRPFASLHKSPLTPMRDMPKKLESSQYNMYNPVNLSFVNTQGINPYVRFPLT